MPSSNIQNVIKKYNRSDAELKRVLLEIKVLNKIYAVAVIYTDNLLYSKNQIATILRKNNAVFAESSARKLFDEKVLVCAVASEEPNRSLEDLATEAAIESGAEDVEVLNEEERRLLFVCGPNDIFTMNKKLGAQFSIESSETTFIPKVIKRRPLPINPF